MDGKKPSTEEDIKQKYAEIARKTADAIAAEGSTITISQTIPQLPRYTPPAPSQAERLRFYNDFSNFECRMFFPTSGHIGFETIKTSNELPSIEIVRDMILYETRLRLSDSIQNLMDEYYTDSNAVTFIHDLIQQHVVEHFGYKDVNALRTALHRFPNDPIIQSAFYDRFF